MKKINKNLILSSLMLTMLAIVPAISSAQNLALNVGVDAKVNSNNANVKATAAMNKNNDVSVKADTFIGTVSTVGTSGFTITNVNNPTVVYSVNTSSNTSFYSGTDVIGLSNIKVGQDVIILGNMSATTTNSVNALLVNTRVDDLKNKDINNRLVINATSTTDADVNAGFFHKVLNWFKRLF